MASSTIPFTIISHEPKVYKGQSIKFQGKNMEISNIKEVEIMDDGSFKVTGTCKPDNLMDMMSFIK